MKVKLTPLQADVRNVFRVTLIKLCIDAMKSNRSVSMIRAVLSVHAYLQVTMGVSWTEQDTKKVMFDIPSIGPFKSSYDCVTWLTVNFRPVGLAILEGNSPEYAMSVWSKTNRVRDNRQWSTSEAYARKRNTRDNAAYRMIGASSFDREQRTAWSKCK